MSSAPRIPLPLALCAVLVSACSSSITPMSPWTGVQGSPEYILDVTGGGPAPSASGGISVLSYGAVGDGNTDDTDAFRDAAEAARDQDKPLVVPATSSFYELSGTVTVYGSVIGTGYPLIKMSGATGARSSTIFAVRGSHLWITGLRLDGGWDPAGQAIPEGSGPNQWSHGIDVSASQSVTISDNEIANTIGDNIYLGGSGKATNVLIQNNRLINGFRCNIAWINADRTVVMSNLIVKRNSFVYALDFEPNDPGAEGAWYHEVAYNDITVPSTIQQPSIGHDLNLQAAGAACSTGSGGYLFLHHNYGSFGASDLVTSGAGFWSNQQWDPDSSCSAAWNGGTANHTSGIYVHDNVSGPSPSGTAPQTD